ncbi:PREDICTED: uncharacterized protein LOC104591252 isoform X1 [Nelumbo nucifera]|uniref:Uncharacterized protein LOC104591252 isoform X1 n=1 Tax=Nelumbo nucifera TaxID=4432 RepID=A0A1U7Z534_NELNU|nr:PREDICTED: uncharacterized protein LOC104591252 isoform X1 [Nelumbo nucifera]
MSGLASSECSSGCESGWTMYLDHSSLSTNPYKRCCGLRDEIDFFGQDFRKEETEEGDEEKDLSMVSDASSGPPHFLEDDDYFEENGCFSSAFPADVLANKSGKRRKLDQRQQQQHLLSFRDDTASSPVFNFSENNLAPSNNQDAMEDLLDFSQGFSATHFQTFPSCESHRGRQYSRSNLVS